MAGSKRVWCVGGTQLEEQAEEPKCLERAKGRTFQADSAHYKSS